MIPPELPARSGSELSLAVALLVVVAGCRTTIPVTDTTAPRVELRISGPGIGKQTMSSPPFSLWEGTDRLQYFDLVAGAEYQFALIVSDDGGVSRAFIQMPIELEVARIWPRDVFMATDAFVRQLTVWGSRADPRSDLSITGRMRPRSATTVGFAFHAEGDDFGGRSGPLHRTFLSVEAFVVAAAP